MNVNEIKRTNCAAWGVQYSENLNPNIALENLVIISVFLSKEINIKYCLFFGTLLGFVRQEGFIAHDQDTDIALFNVSEEFIACLKKKLIREEFYIFRDDTDMLSAMRKGEYIDFHKFYKVGSYFQNVYFIFPVDLFIKFIDVELANGHKVNIPEDSTKILELIYGKTWRTPLESHHASGLSSGKNSRLNFKPYLMLYKFYIKGMSSNTPLRFIVNIRFTRLIVIIINSVFDFIYSVFKKLSKKST
jgi:phosphorylcholine metabolism protein LicD